MKIKRFTSFNSQHFDLLNRLRFLMSKVLFFCQSGKHKLVKLFVFFNVLLTEILISGRRMFTCVLTEQGMKKKYLPSRCLWW